MAKIIKQLPDFKRANLPDSVVKSLSSCVVDKIYDKAKPETLKGLADGNKGATVSSSDKTLIQGASLQCTTEVRRQMGPAPETSDRAGEAVAVLELREFCSRRSTAALERTGGVRAELRRRSSARFLSALARPPQPSCRQTAHNAFKQRQRAFQPACPNASMLPQSFLLLQLSRHTMRQFSTELQYSAFNDSKPPPNSPTWHAPV